MITVKHGILHDGIMYGWIDKQLYRLPSTKGNKTYCYKKMTPTMVGNNAGYYFGRRKKTLAQLQQITTIINQRIFLTKDEDLPF